MPGLPRAPPVLARRARPPTIHRGPQLVFAKALDQKGPTYGYQWAATRSTAYPPDVAKALDRWGRLAGIDSDPPPRRRSSVRVTSAPPRTDGTDAQRDLHGGGSGVLEASYPATEPFTPGSGASHPATGIRKRHGSTTGFAFVIISPSGRQH